MDENKTALRLFREGRNRMYRWIQKWMGRGANEETEGYGDPVDAWHIVNLLRAGLGFRLRHVDQGQGMLPCEEGPGCRVVVTCTFSGLRAVLELPQSTCCCHRPTRSDSETHFWSVSSSTESLHEAGCSSLPELNQGLGKVVKEVLSQLHHVITELSNPLAVSEIAAKILTTGSLQSLSPNPGMETMRRVSSSPILSNSSPGWSNQAENEKMKYEETAVSLQEFPSIPSTEISPIKGSIAKSVPSFRTSSPRSVQSSLERLSIRSNPNIVDKLEDIHKELGQIISLVKGNSPNVMEKTKKLQAVNSSASKNSTPNSTPRSLRKPLASRVIPSSSRTQLKRTLQAPQTVPRDKTMIKPHSTVKKFFSGSKPKNTQPDTPDIASKATPVVAKRRLTPQMSAQKMDTKLKADQKKIK